jgi:hypothetical protein
VKADTALAANRGEFFDGLDGSSLIVCVHHGNENGLPAKGGLEILGIHASSSVNRQDSEVEAFMVLEMLESVKHGMMLCGGGDEMPAARGMGSRNA